MRAIRAGTWKPSRTPTKPLRKPRTEEIAWAAGFYEGEGSVSALGTLVAQITQVNREPLERFVPIFGGRIHSIRGTNTIGPLHGWYVGGALALSFFEQVEPWLSDKRRVQIKTALEELRRRHWKPREDRLPTYAIERVCEFCGGGFRAHQTGRGTGRFCSRSCARRSRAGWTSKSV